MTKHTVSDTNPDHVTGADSYRISMTGLLTPDYPKFAVMEEATIKPEHRRADGYGVAFLESEEHSVLYVGPVEQLTDYRAASAGGGARLDVTQGVMYDRWPHGEGWDDYIPRNTWNPDGEGIITAFDHPQGGKVYVYEYVKTDDGRRVPMVTLHCEQCHNISEGFGGGGEGERENRGPHDRRWTARLARIHIRRPDDNCRPTDPRFAEAVTAVMNADDGGSRPVVTAESQCATTGPCSRIRHFRARKG
jgi:hypothetical protein